jgi:hypothetical protein
VDNPSGWRAGRRTVSGEPAEASARCGDPHIDIR